MMPPQRCPKCRAKKAALAEDAPKRFEIICDHCGKHDTVTVPAKDRPLSALQGVPRDIAVTSAIRITRKNDEIKVDPPAPKFMSLRRSSTSLMVP